MISLTEAQKGHLAMLCFSALVAGSFSLGGMAAPFIDPVALNFVRFILAGAAIWAAVYLTGGLTRASFAAPWRYLVLGGLFALYFVLMFEGLKTAPPVNAAAVFTLTPVLAAVASFLLIRQVTTVRIAVALFVGAVGALWVIFRADFAAFLRFEVGRGEIIYFVGCVSHAIYIPVIRMLNRGERPLVFSLLTICGALVPLAIFGLGPVLQTDWTSLPSIVWIAIFYTALFASAFTFVLLQFASLRLPASKVMAYTYLTPSWVIGWEIALGHGAPTALILVGVGLTIVALVLLLRDEEAVAVKPPQASA